MAETNKGVCVIWKLINFSMLPHQNGNYLNSPKFAIDSKTNTNFFLRLYPKGTTEAKGYISLFLYKATDDLNLNLNVSFKLVSTVDYKHLLSTFNWENAKGGNGFPKFEEIAKICGNNNPYLPEDTLTLRCKINMIDETSVLNENDPSPSKPLRKCSVYHTGIQVHQKEAITWPIRNIKESIEREGKTSILLPSASKTIPSLKLSLDFSKTEKVLLSTYCIGISIQRMCLSLEDEQIFVKCKITVISANIQCDAFKESTHLFDKKLDDVWHISPFILKTMLTQENYLYTDDTLHLLFEFSFSLEGDIYHSVINDVSYNYDTRKKRKISELGSCIDSIYCDKKFCDVKFKLGRNTFPYYKAILCARSSVFSAMFETDMKEKDSNVVKITDIDPITFKRMLKFMHSDVMEENLSHEDACKLYKAADKYDIKPLKRRCSVLLISALSMENMSNLLALADAHNDDFLMIALENFICSHGQEMLHSPHWKNFVDSNPKLSANIMLQILTGKYKIVEKYSDVNGKV